MNPFTLLNNRGPMLELKAIRIGLEILIERMSGGPISLIALAKSDEVVESAAQPPLTDEAITYERPQSLIDAETYEEEETDEAFVAASGGFKKWKPTVRVD